MWDTVFGTPKGIIFINLNQFFTNNVEKIIQSCRIQTLNLTQHIEDSFEQGQITGVASIGLSTAYDTVNHQRLLAKLYAITRGF